MPMLWNRKYTREDLLKHVGAMRQLASAQPVEFTEGGERGVRAVILKNGTGLEITVIPDRGMMLYDVSYKGIPLAFKNAVGPVHPGVCGDKGLDFLQCFPAGFLNPCGLSNVGSPCTDNGRDHGLHGRINTIAAHEVSTGGGWTDDGGYEVFVRGAVREARFFGENLLLTRTVRARVGEPQLWVDDAVRNEGTERVPLMFLQHINLGFPLIDEGTMLMVPPGTTQPRDAEAAKGIDEWQRFIAPQREYAEQVFYHDCGADPEGYVHVAVINRQFDQGSGLGVYLQYKKDDYPVLVEWKMMKQGCYVVGVEPGNCHVEGRAAERSRGTLQMIEPGQTRTFGLEVGVLSGQRELDAVENDFEWA